jgi:hypothetical protein
VASRGLIAAVLSGSTLICAASSSAVADSVPDFSGAWGRNTFNFEQPDAGLGPIVNLRRLGAYAGFTVVDGDPIPLVGDYKNPILKPEAAAVVKKNGEYSESGHDVPDPSNQCGAFAPPYLFSIGLGLDMVQRKNDIVIFPTQGSGAVRRVRLNSSHPRSLKPTPSGDSIGHYEGDTLVIDTVGIQLMPYTVVDRFGTPQSEAMHVIERYRLIDAKEGRAALDRHAKVVGTTGPIAPDPKADKALRVELTVEDPKIFTAPWRANVTFLRVIRGYNEGVCAENNVDAFHLGDTHIPTASTPDF